MTELILFFYFEVKSILVLSNRETLMVKTFIFMRHNCKPAIFTPDSMSKQMCCHQTNQNGLMCAFLENKNNPVEVN